MAGVHTLSVQVSSFVILLYIQFLERSGWQQGWPFQKSIRATHQNCGGKTQRADRWIASAGRADYDAITFIKRI